MTRVLHVLKTSDGGRWAAIQARELVRAGVEVHAALPRLEGGAMELWKTSGAHLHAVDLNFPTRRLWLAGGVLRAARTLVEQVRPDLLHSHFVSTTLTLRAAFGRAAGIPRLFQVPGPLHLEHGLYRRAEIASAGNADYWIATSAYTRDLYRRSGVPEQRVFLSYYGVEHPLDLSLAPIGAERPIRMGGLRGRLGIPKDALVVGNINMFYAPKKYLGQFIGIKGHERIMDALELLTAARSDVYGVLAGGAWGDSHAYFETLRTRARAISNGRILLPGELTAEDVPHAWKEFDCAVHVPLSENCGGVVEPLLAGVPVIAGRTGGLPEVVVDGVTGVTVPASKHACKPRTLADAILEVLEIRERHRKMARTGSALVREMFSPVRTAAEIKNIYEFVLGHTAAVPAEFDSKKVLMRESNHPSAACA